MAKYRLQGRSAVTGRIMTVAAARAAKATAYVQRIRIGKGKGK